MKMVRLEIKVTKLVEDTTISKIIHLSGRSTGEKSTDRSIC